MVELGGVGVPTYRNRVVIFLAASMILLTQCTSILRYGPKLMYNLWDELFGDAPHQNLIKILCVQKGYKNHGMLRNILKKIILIK